MNTTRHPELPDHRSDNRRSTRWPRWVRSWTLACTLTSGVLALLWLLLRSGPRPSRLAYPCQQAAFGFAAAAFGAPFVTAAVSLRRHLVAGMRTGAGKIAAGVLTVSVTLVLAIASVEPGGDVVISPPPDGYRPDVYLVNDARGIEPGRYGGVDDLITLMGLGGLKWHRSGGDGLTAGPDGLIDTDDVVLIKVNAQWPQRGGTNTDVLRGVIRRIVEHPDGFVGEIIVADNGQGWGSHDRTEHNAEDHEQSTQDVVDDFVSGGWNVSTSLWDDFRGVSVDEYSDGDPTDGYVVSATYDPQTRIKVSYPKFKSASGTCVSYKYGIWSPTSQTYDPDKLVVINIPVFKTHVTYGITAGVKNHMGVVTQSLTTDSHGSVGRGGLGSFLAEVRMPDLTILDCIWILAHPDSGPWAYYSQATRRDQLLASTDPVALDIWATKFIMIPQIIENGYSYSDYHNTQDPDNPDSDFREYLDRTMNEMLLAGIKTTNSPDAVSLHVWVGDVDRDGDIDATDFGEVALCLSGPAGDLEPDCGVTDFDEDADVDLADFAAFQRTFTGPWQ